MTITKEKIVDIPGVYSVSQFFEYKNNLGKEKIYFVAASENRGEHSYIIDSQTLEYSELWEGDTGVMNIVQIPGKNQLLCITKFYPIFQSKEAVVNLLTPVDGQFMKKWIKKEVLSLPFVHRIGIVRNDSGLFLLGCTLCKGKDFQEDWSQPGSLWVAPIPEKTNEEWFATEVYSGLTKNHGLFVDGNNQVYIGSQNGLMLFDFEKYKAGEMISPVILSSAPTSDVSIMDKPDTDEKLIGTIEPFHGDCLSLYSLKSGVLKKVSSYPISFGHVVWVGQIFGRDVVISGSRGGQKNLEMYFINEKESITIDKDVGSTQISIYFNGGVIKIISANHGSGDVSLYTVSE